MGNSFICWDLNLSVPRNEINAFKIKETMYYVLMEKFLRQFIILIPKALQHNVCT